MSSIIENVRENHERILKALDEKYAGMNMKEIEMFQMDLLHYIHSHSEMNTGISGNYQLEILTVTSDKDNITEEEFQKVKKAL